MKKIVKMNLFSWYAYKILSPHVTNIASEKFPEFRTRSYNLSTK